MTRRSNSSIKARRETLSKQEDLSDQLHSSLSDLMVELRNENSTKSNGSTLIQMDAALQEFKQQTRDATEELNSLCDNLKNIQAEIDQLKCGIPVGVQLSGGRDKNEGFLSPEEDRLARFKQDLQKIKKNAMEELNDSETVGLFHYI